MNRRPDAEFIAGIVLMVGAAKLQPWRLRGPKPIATWSGERILLITDSGEPLIKKGCVQPGVSFVCHYGLVEAVFPYRWKGLSGSFDLGAKVPPLPCASLRRDRYIVIL